MSDRKQRSSIDKQEKLVGLMWGLAAAAQRNEPEGIVIQSANGCRMSDATMRYYLKEMMACFGYRVLEVQ